MYSICHSKNYIFKALYHHSSVSYNKAVTNFHKFNFFLFLVQNNINLKSDDIKLDCLITMEQLTFFKNSEFKICKLSLKLITFNIKNLYIEFHISMLFWSVWQPIFMTFKNNASPIKRNGDCQLDRTVISSLGCPGNWNHRNGKTRFYSHLILSFIITFSLTGPFNGEVQASHLQPSVFCSSERTRLWKAVCLASIFYGF